MLTDSEFTITCETLLWELLSACSHTRCEGSADECQHTACIALHVLPRIACVLPRISVGEHDDTCREKGFVRTKPSSTVPSLMPVCVSSCVRPRVFSCGSLCSLAILQSAASQFTECLGDVRAQYPDTRPVARAWGVNARACTIRP